MSNRDFFRKPIQSDRNSFGYGNTKLDRNAGWGERPLPVWAYAVIGGAIAIIGVAAL